MNLQAPTPEALALPAAACTPEGYWEFFESYVRSERVRAAYTWPQVQVRRLQAQDQNVATLKKENYDGFRIGLDDSRWVYLDATNQAGQSARLDLQEHSNGQTFRVDYTRAVFEEAEDGDEKVVKTYGDPGAYVFEFRNGCWHLTQELR